jgi:hypothetical protein
MNQSLKFICLKIDQSGAKKPDLGFFTCGPKEGYVRPNGQVLSSPLFLYTHPHLRWLDIVITKTLLTNRELKTG